MGFLRGMWINRWIVSTVILLLALGVLLFRYFKLSVRRPSDPVERNMYTEGQGCVQRTGSEGWRIDHGQVVTMPRCLSVMNSRFGSRLNLDFMNGGSAFYSSVLGNLEDRDIGFTLLVDGNPLLPMHANAEFPFSEVRLGLTYQEIVFENEYAKVIVRITSPFSPSQTVDDPAFRMSHAPFFYIDLAYLNKTSRVQNPSIRMFIHGYDSHKVSDNSTTVYFRDPIRKDGVLAVAIQEKPEIAVFGRGDSGGYVWTPSVRSSETTSLPVVYAGYVPKAVMTDTSDQQALNPMMFAYTQWFSSVDDVLSYASKNRSNFRKRTDTFEQRVQRQFADPKDYWIASQAFHSYLGNSWLVYPKNQPKNYRYIVWEGEFKYHNTVDVAHEYGVLEGKLFPWVLKVELDEWRQSAKNDTVGKVIPHDIGIRFDMHMRQTYGTKDMFPSAMPVEENANYLLLSYWYWFQTKDNAFVAANEGFFLDLFRSLTSRDTNGNGLADVVGITTYDNDGNTALLRAPDNVYLGIKQLAAYLCLAEMLRISGNTSGMRDIVSEAEKIRDTLVSYRKTNQIIPISLDKDFQEPQQESQANTSPAIVMGFLYPALTKLESPVLDDVIRIVSADYQDIRNRTLLHGDAGNVIGETLSAIQMLNLGWISSVFAQNFIANTLFGMTYTTSDYVFENLYDSPYSYADGLYVGRNMLSPNMPLKFYPRGVVIFTAIDGVR